MRIKTRELIIWTDPEEACLNGSAVPACCKVVQPLQRTCLTEGLFDLGANIGYGSRITSHDGDWN